MIVPIVYSLAPWDHKMAYGWNFVKSLDFASKYRWPVIAPARYFNWENLMLVSPALTTEPIMDLFDYEKPTKALLERIIPFPIPVLIEKAFISEYPSRTDAYFASVTQDWPAMEDFFCEAIRQAEKQTGEKAEAIMALTDHQFLRNVARKLDISCVFYEFSSIRKPFYDRRIYYMDFHGLQENAKLAERYNAFQSQSKSLPILKRRELLALFLRKEDLYYIGDEKWLQEPQFEMGIALPANEVFYGNAHNMINIDELSVRALELFEPDALCFRFHPNHQEKIIPGAAHIDKGSLFDFILRCKRVVCAGSNTAFDAALFNRPAYDVGWSIYNLLANRSLEGLADAVPTDELLSFIVFCFFVPSELLWSPEYLRYRLTKPSEEALYWYHLSFIFNALSLDKSVLDLPSSERFNAILSNRMGNEPARSYGKMEAPIWGHADEKTRREIQFLRLQRAVECLRMEQVQLSQQLVQVQAKQEQQLAQVQMEKEQQLAQVQAEKEQQLAQVQAGKEQQLAQVQMEKEQQLAQLTAQLTAIYNSRSYKLARVAQKLVAPFRRRETE